MDARSAAPASSPGRTVPTPPDRRRAGPRLHLRDLRRPRWSSAGDTTPSGDPIEIETAIEVGNIFKLGTRYSEPLGATYLDPDGVERPIVDGQLRDRPGPDRRRIGRAAGRRARDRLAAVRSRPGRFTSCALGKGGDEVADAAEALYEALEAAGDRDAARRSHRSGHGGEADRRRADRLSAADHRRQARPRRGRRRGAGPLHAARTNGSRSPTRRSACGRSSRASTRGDSGARRREATAALATAPVRHRPLRPGAAADPRRAAAAPVHAAEPDRLRAARRDPGLPRDRASAPATAATRSPR